MTRSTRLEQQVALLKQVLVVFPALASKHDRAGPGGPLGAVDVLDLDEDDVTTLLCLDLFPKWIPGPNTVNITEGAPYDLIQHDE
jgi:hypothetical protein